MSDTDELIAEALRRAPAHMAAVAAPGHAEAELETALRLGLIEAGVPADRIGARRRYIDRYWVPLPGGIDLYVTHPGGGDLAWVAELKYAKVDETLWDLIKVASALALRQRTPVAAAYLIVAAGDKAWSARGNCSELFGGESDHDLLELIADNRDAWCGLLQGGRARPTTPPRHLHVTPIACARVPQRPGVTIRAVRVDVVGGESLRFDADGWPSDLDDHPACRPPGTRRASSTSLRLIDCAGFPVPARFTSSIAANDAWLADNVPLMTRAQLQAFEAVLCARGWREDELDGRVRPWAAVALWHDLDALLHAVAAGARNRDSALHGPEHWHSVAAAAVRLLHAGERADRPLALLFALLHDARRLDDGTDHEHGPRAADLLHELLERGLLDMPELRATRLDDALRAHARGAVSEDPTIALCWDADRLDIGRVGYALDPALFSTATGRALTAGADPRPWAQGPPDWHELARRLGL